MWTFDCKVYQALPKHPRQQQCIVCTVVSVHLSTLWYMRLLNLVFRVIAELLLELIEQLEIIQSVIYWCALSNLELFGTSTNAKLFAQTVKISPTVSTFSL